MTVRLVAPSLVVLVGPSASGKSTWAARHFEPHQVVSSDALRALVGEGEHDRRAGTDAFEVLDDVLRRRLRRRLMTVVDTLGLDAVRRKAYVALAREAGLRVYAVAFDTPAKECRTRNKAREHRVPSKALSAQLASFEQAAGDLASEGFDGVFPAGDVEIVSPAFASARDAAARQKESPVTLRFGLQIPRFEFEGQPDTTADHLAGVARAAEDAGFDSLWVMDHFIQIPQAGREWEDMLDSWTTLSFLAAHTARVRLGPLVTGVTYRNVAHLAKIAATLDVLSGGRVVCGLGAAWFEREHKAYGWAFPPAPERFALLEDALRVLPLMWGKGAPAFEGRVLTIPEAICYPRPLQDPIPILVGGSGERTTLRLVAKYADACNFFGDAANVSRKLEVLREHCDRVGRDVAEIEVTHLGTALVGEDAAHVERLLDNAPSGANRAAYAAATNAATIDDHIGRFRELAEAGVQTAIVNFPDLTDAAPVARFAPIIEAFAG